MTNPNETIDIFYQNCQDAFKKITQELIDFFAIKREEAYFANNKERAHYLASRIAKFEDYHRSSINVMNFFKNEASSEAFQDLGIGFQEYLEKKQIKSYFGKEKEIVKMMVKLPNDDVALNRVYVLFENEFIKTRGNDFANAIDNFKVNFYLNLHGVFGRYDYLSWELYLWELKNEKPSFFPCFNDIIKRIDKIQNSFISDVIAILKECKFL